MAIYHFSAKMIKRSEGQSATAHAAYCAHEKITDLRTGEVHDYRRRNLRDKISYAEIIAPANAPDFCDDRSSLWGQVELVEKRKDAQVARSVTVALPVELSPEQNKQLARRFCEETFATQGMVADCCIHEIESDNPHAHIILTTRELTPEGFGKKNRDWNDKKTLEAWRKSWSEYANDALKAAQIDQQIDHRSYKDQANNLIPGVHLGKTVSEMERQGKQTPRGNINRLVAERNLPFTAPPRHFDEEATALAELDYAIEDAEAPQHEKVDFFEAELKARSADATLNGAISDAFNRTVEQRVQHTLKLSQHRTKRRIIKKSPRKLIQQSQTLSKRLREEIQPRQTAEAKVARMGVFDRLKSKIADAGKSIWDAIKKPFVEPKPEPRKEPESTVPKQPIERSEEKATDGYQPQGFKR